ncbi:MAG: cytochrome c biogenesis protein ResB [Deltaproteobacteria bacterium]|nr:cytochrome c biogenesis protein ResB [Deltaproteobacteria bacterium]MBW2048998.1 cytochrome c biogenesis protein ResB [Deltaproteobacteria bacterium]MBW2111838.1 cytochrome c biogenesis protein ResB [Deltaproteobacteria bacterium]MBW2354114.1 cytochrome c biogenesis protein ResB [Deltaproteobacteria bacterium]
MTKSKSQGRPSVIWGFFSSVKLTFVLLIILALVSIVGTLIPQQEGAAEFARDLSPAMLRIFTALDFFNMYQSLWFRVLIGFLAMNLIVCSLDRFAGTWRRFTARPEPDRKRPFEHLPPAQTFLARGRRDEMVAGVNRLLGSRYRKLRKKEAGTGHFFYGERGGYSLFGVYLVHTSVLLILVGSLVGSFFGFDAYVNILEGEQTGTVRLRRTMEPLKLGFQVRCNRFNVEFYDNGSPKEYRSDLSFLVDGKVVAEKSVLVNHPVEFMGVTFYQANYGKAPGKRVHLNVSSGSAGSGATHMDVEQGKPVPLPGGGGTFQVVDMRGDIMNMGPAVLISVKPDQGRPVEFWVFKHWEMVRKMLPEPMRKSPKFDPAGFKPYTFYLEALETRYYTGLQANRDPGVPVVWAGCFLMIAGLFITFFLSHKRIWVRLRETGKGMEISVAGMSNKNPVGLQREVEGLVDDLKDLLLRKKG